MAIKRATESTEAFITRVNTENKNEPTPFYQGYLDASIARDHRRFVDDDKHKLWLDGYIDYALDADAAK